MQSGKAPVQEAGVHAAKDQKQIWTSEPLFERGAYLRGEGSLSNLAKMVVSVLHKELGCN